MEWINNVVMTEESLFMILGGGTFDISIIEIAEVDGEHQFEVSIDKRRYFPWRRGFRSSYY